MSLPPSLKISSQQIKAEALSLGFSACGLAPAEAVDETTSASFRQWLADGCQAEMTYMQNYEDKRLDPRLLVEGARTVISVALNYYPVTRIPENEYQIAWYAYGKDYHDVMKAKLSALQEYIQKHLYENDQSTLPSIGDTLKVGCNPIGSDPKASCNSIPLLQEGGVVEDRGGRCANSRVFCDTAPILERYWAWRAGLGWIGKNTQLLIPHAGSCFFLGELILNAEADSYDSPLKSRCGSCTRCLNACPTKALEAPYRLNSKRCLSYLTIEHRGAFNASTGQEMGKKIYGCDECQRACPWNRFATPARIAELHPSPTLLGMQKKDWHCLTEEQYKTLFKGSAVKRAKYAGLMRNIESAKDYEKQTLRRITD